VDYHYERTHPFSFTTQITVAEVGVREFFHLVADFSEVTALALEAVIKCAGYVIGFCAHYHMNIAPTYML